LGSPSVSGISSLNRCLSSNRCSDCRRLTATERRELFILTVETSCCNPAKEVCSPLSSDTMVAMSDGVPSSGFLAMEAPVLVAKGWQSRLVAGGGGRLHKLSGVREKNCRWRRIAGSGYQLLWQYSIRVKSSLLEALDLLPDQIFPPLHERLLLYLYAKGLQLSISLITLNRVGLLIETDKDSKTD
jgi:hypothetical protein